MKKLTRIIGAILICLCCTSCVTLWPFNQTEPIDNLRKNLTVAQERVETSRVELEESSGQIRDSAEDIQDDAQEIEKRIPADTDKDIRARLGEIENNAEAIIGETDNLEGIASRLQRVRKNLVEVEGSTDDAVSANKDLVEKIQQLEDDKRIALRKAMNYLIIIAILLIAISAVGVFQGNYKAIGGIIGGVIIIVASLAVSVLYMKLAWIGLVGILGVVLIVGFGIYQGISNKRNRTKDEKALEETVLTVEALKTKLPEDAKKDFFGDNAYPGKAATIQSKETEAKVLTIRRKLKDVISPTIPGN